MRNVDHWRKLASEPLLNWRFVRSDDRQVWALDVDGKRISQWREVDAPGLGDWFATIYARYHGAWHVAQTQLGIVTKNKRGGDAAGSDRKDEAKANDRALATIALRILKEEGPMSNSALAQLMDDRGHGGRESLRKKLPRLLAVHPHK